MSSYSIFKMLELSVNLGYSGKTPLKMLRVNWTCGCILNGLLVTKDKEKAEVLTFLASIFPNNCLHTALKCLVW